jgi:hypothetical protein
LTTKTFYTRNVSIATFIFLQTLSTDKTLRLHFRSLPCTQNSDNVLVALREYDDNDANPDRTDGDEAIFISRVLLIIDLQMTAASSNESPCFC